MIRTKIVATMGPACGSADKLFRLFEAGVNVCRLNFSHGSLAEHAKMLGNIREAASWAKRPVAVLGDLCGPKIRLGKVLDQDGTGGMPIAPGGTLVLQRQPIDGAAGRASTTYAHVVDDVNPGDRVLVDDFMLRSNTTEKN